MAQALPIVGPGDRVRLTRNHSWKGVVAAAHGNRALVQVLSVMGRTGMFAKVWVDLEFLELAPGQQEDMAA